MAAHLVLYFAVLRHLPAFRTERTIFLYHALSALGVSLVAIASLFVPGSEADLAWVVAVIALHGIYSTTFLEVWSLAEGGFSLQIVEHIERAKRLRVTSPTSRRSKRLASPNRGTAWRGWFRSGWCGRMKGVCR